MTNDQNSEYMSRSELNRLGLTDTNIKKMLGDPDKLGPNPRFPTGAPAQLFSAAKVEKVMKTPEARAAVENTLARRKRLAEKNAATVRITSAAFELQGLGGLAETDITQAAIGHYNRSYVYEIAQGTKPEAVSGMPKPSLARITVEYIIHQYSNHGQLLDTINGKAVKTEAQARMWQLMPSQLEALGFTELVAAYRADQCEPDACELEPQYQIYLADLGEYETQCPPAQRPAPFGELDEFAPDDEGPQVDSEALEYETGLNYL